MIHVTSISNVIRVVPHQLTVPLTCCLLYIHTIITDSTILYFNVMEPLVAWDVFCISLYWKVCILVSLTVINGNLKILDQTFVLASLKIGYWLDHYIYTYTYSGPGGCQLQFAIVKCHVVVHRTYCSFLHILYVWPKW